MYCWDVERCSRWINRWDLDKIRLYCWWRELPHWFCWKGEQPFEKTFGKFLYTPRKDPFEFWFLRMRFRTHPKVKRWYPWAFIFIGWYSFLAVEMILSIINNYIYLMVIDLTFIDIAIWTYENQLYLAEFASFSLSAFFNCCKITFNLAWFKWVFGRRSPPLSTIEDEALDSEISKLDLFVDVIFSYIFYFLGS